MRNGTSKYAQRGTGPSLVQYARKRYLYSSLRDTLTSHRHSKDFSHARADYLRRRVVVIGLLFLLLTPFWIGVDVLILPQSVRTWTLPGRLVMVIGLILTLLIARRSDSSVASVSRSYAGSADRPSESGCRPDAVTKRSMLFYYAPTPVCIRPKRYRAIGS